MMQNPFTQERNHTKTIGILAAINLLIAVMNKQITTDDDAEKFIRSIVGNDETAFNFACLVFYDYVIQAKNSAAKGSSSRTEGK
jgi:hypothetical protein